MLCPICNWNMTERHQWSSAGFALGLFFCNDCECEVSIKAPISKVPSWPIEKPVKAKPRKNKKS